MLDSDFWQDLSTQFLSVRQGGFNLTWLRESDSNLTFDFKHCSEATFLHFKTIAQRAGQKLASDAIVPFRAWICALIERAPNERPGQHLGADGIYRESGTISNVCNASVNLCRFLESEALQAEHHRFIANREPPIEEVQDPEPKQTEENCTRSQDVGNFLRKCNRLSTTRIYKHHISRSVGHHTARQFEYWQACNDKKATPEDQRNFSRILRTSPEEFLATLKRQKLIPQDKD